MEILQNIVSNWLWGPPLIIIILATGIFLTVISGFFQFKHFFYSIKQSLKRMFTHPEPHQGAVEDEDKRLSPLEAISIAIGTTIGVGNIAGVATAIATGGPGAVFWLWLAGFLGQTIKMVEISLAVHYRSPDPEGTTFGGPTYYIKKGIGEKRNNKSLYKLLNFLFLGGFVGSFLLTMQNYTVSEAIAGTFDTDMLTVSIIYTVLVYIMIAGGLKWLGRIATKLVPFMCLFFLLGGIFIILKHSDMIPNALGLIFEGAFNGTAVVGGFAGAAFARVVQVGMSRAVFSNEAGLGNLSHDSCLS